MGANTLIEWARHTFNPWVGCTKLSLACDFCYAEGWAKRSGRVVWGEDRQRTSATNWQQPIRWNREAETAGERARVFCASLADVFDNQVPSRWREDLWHLIEQTPHLDWLLLTKRPQNIVKMLPDPRTGGKPWGTGWPHVWLGTTAENQDEADRRIRHLLAAPAAVRFVSMEPLLGPVDLTRLDQRTNGEDGAVWTDALRGWTVEAPDGDPDDADQLEDADGKLDWVITGGESGPKARPMHPDWARDLRDQCAATDVPFLFKQWGEFIGAGQYDAERWCICGPSYSAGDPIRVGKKAAGRLLDGVEHNGFPEGRR